MSLAKRHWLLAGISLIALSACSVKVAQVDTVRRFIPAGDEQRRLDNFAWAFTLAGTEYRLYATRIEGRNAYFTNDIGMNLVWDGESIIVLENLPGSFGRYESGREITAQGIEERWYARAGEPVQRARCSPMREWRLTDDRYGWRQECTTERDGVVLPAVHLLERDGRGLVRLIQAPIAPGGPLITLRRLNP